VAVKPDKQDFDAVESEYGPLPPSAGKSARAERYRLAQAAKVIRQLEQVVLTGNARITKSVGSIRNNAEEAPIGCPLNNI
jgi:hypothetical protein